MQPTDLTGIVIAAGLGSRMGTFARERPKCLLPVAGRSLLDWTLGHFQACGCDRSVAVVGHLAAEISRPGLITVENTSYRENNILHSLMCASDYFDGGTLISYSDIFVEPRAYSTLTSTKYSISLCIDVDWQDYYINRSQHPTHEAEKAYIEPDGKVVAVGKHLSASAPPGLLCGEFTGLWRMDRAGTQIWREHFSQLNSKLDPDQPFQNAKAWRKAYVTDMLQDLIDRGVDVHSALIRRGWAELDTPEDVERLPRIAARQRLDTIVSAINQNGMSEVVAAHGET